jgi:hypothetical protein
MLMANETSFLASSDAPFFKSFLVLLLEVAQLVEALRYKPEGRGFDSRW